MEQISVTPMISIRPNRISLTQFVRRIKLYDLLASPNGGFTSGSSAGTARTTTQSVKPKLVKKFHNFEISVNSQRNLRDKISYLFQFAKSRSVKTYSGKTIPNFKICFLTLTLPSAQVHPTADISKMCLEPLLEILRKRLNMANYVWRMEFQANGNVHYHLATDTYIDYFFVQKHWNAILEKLGYVSRFANIMQSMPYTEYLKRYSQNGKVPAEIIYKRWVKGKSEKWQKPNTVDVKSAKSSDSIGYYISKYFSKKEKGAKQNALDNQENAFALRLCFWSRSLSRCKSESMPFDYYAQDLVKYFTACKEVMRYVFDYCTVLYFSFNKLPPILRSVLGEYFGAMQREINYAPA